MAAMLLALTACSTGDDTPAAPPIPKSFNFIGDFRLSGARWVGGDLQNCGGVSYFVDVHPTARVTVTNQNGKPLATGSITYGSGTNFYQDTLDECLFRFVVLNVPRAKSYFVIIGRQRAHPVALQTVVATEGKIKIEGNKPNVPYRYPQIPF
jgi:hypothetical protein